MEEQELVVVCSDRQCRHLHEHRLLNGIRICERLDILSNVLCRIDK